MGAGGVDAGELKRREEDLLLILRGAGQHGAVGPRDEAAAPELEPVAAFRALVADAVDGGDVAAVGDRVGALDGFLSLVLRGAVGGFFAGMPADRGRIEE